MITVGLFGGSFNPPHVAHLLAAVYALSTAPIDEVLAGIAIKGTQAFELPGELAAALDGMQHDKPNFQGFSLSLTVANDLAPLGYSARRFGVWRSLVARLLWVQEAEGSNPFAPTPPRGPRGPFRPSRDALIAQGDRASAF